VQEYIYISPMNVAMLQNKQKPIWTPIFNEITVFQLVGNSSKRGKKYSKEKKNWAWISSLWPKFTPYPFSSF